MTNTYSKDTLCVIPPVASSCPTASTEEIDNAVEKELRVKVHILYGVWEYYEIMNLFW